MVSSLLNFVEPEVLVIQQSSGERSAASISMVGFTIASLFLYFLIDNAVDNKP